MVRRSMRAFGKRSPALKVRSTTAPVDMLRIFARTNAAPLPGFTCWNSTTCQGSLSMVTVTLVLNSLVEIII